MIRFLLSLMILVLIVTYLVLPAIKYFNRFLKSEGKRIDNIFNKEKKSKLKKGGDNWWVQKALWV